MNTSAASALLVEMIESASHEAKAEIVRLLRPELVLAIDSIATASGLADGWMDLKTASAYAGVTPDAMHKRTAAGTVPFEQDVPGGKCWFKRSKIDAWRRGEWRAGDRA